MPVMSTATDFGALEASLIPVNDTHQHDEISADLLLHDIDDDTYQQGKHKTSVAGATFSYVCTTVGAGVLSLPAALAQGGWCGLFIILFTSILCNITGKYLAGCMFAIPGKPLRTYEDIGVAAIGPMGRPLVAFFQCITLFGVCTIFLILIGGNMHTLVDGVTLHVWVFIFGFCLIPVSWIKTMAEISYLAYFGVGTSLFVAVVVVIKGCIAGANHEMTQGKPVSHDIITDFNGFSLAFNIIVFSFGGHSVLPAIVNEMSDARHNYHRLCNYAFGTIAAIYTCVTAAGYWGYGSETMDNVLKNMDSSSGIVKCAYAMITAHVLLAYPIPLNPVSLYMEEVFGIDKIQNNWRKEWITRIILRSSLVLSTIFLASVVPYFGDILSIVSALSVIAVAFVLPPLFYYRLYRHTLTHLHIFFLWFVITFGILSSIVGII